MVGERTGQVQPLRTTTVTSGSEHHLCRNPLEAGRVGMHTEPLPYGLQQGQEATPALLSEGAAWGKPHLWAPAACWKAREHGKMLDVREER